MTSSPAPSSSPTASRRLARAIAHLSLRWPVQVLVGGLFVAGLFGFFASKLSLQTDLAELLPPTARSVVLLKQVNKRIGGSGNVAIALESIDGKPDALRLYIPRLVAELKRQLGRDLLSVKYQRKEVSDFYEKYGAWYVSVEDLARWADRLGEAVAKEENPLLGAFDDLDETPKPAPPAPRPAPSAAAPAGAAPDAAPDKNRSEIEKVIDEVRAARKKVQPQNVADPESGLLIGEDGRIAVVFVRPAADALNLAGSGGMLERLKAIVESTHPEQAGVRLPEPGYTGSIPSAITEYAAVQRDILSTAALVCFLVGLVVVLYFRGLREILLLSGALVIGATVAMGFAWLWIGHVNGQTAFLGSIIVGTGINYGIILLDRYRRARAADLPLGVALEQACDESLRATWIAALGTAVSFGVLAAGEVESFHQFGWIGGLGILACWVASFTFVPAMLVLVDRNRPAHAKPRLMARLFPWSPLDWTFLQLGRVVARFPLAVVVLTVLAMVGSAVVAVTMRHGVIETNMGNLGTKSRNTKMETLDHRLRPMDDRSSTPEVIAADNREDAIAVCKILLARRDADLSDVMTNCHTIGDIFPKDAEARPPLFKRLRRDLAKISDADLKPDEKQEVAKLMTLLDAPAPGDDDFPGTLKEYYVERDGSLGKLAFVDPRDEHIEEKLYRFTDAIRSVTLPSGKVIETSGFTVVFADIIRAMRRDTLKLSLWSAVLVLIVLAAVTRNGGTFLRVGGALVAGVIVMLGVAVLMQQKLNFFNFVALPTTFGIGVDYGINIEERLRGVGRKGIPAALAACAPAVMLASLTSVFGYVSLLTADSRALNSFGNLAIIGEITCTFFAVTLIPALFALRASREPAPGQA